MARRKRKRKKHPKTTGQQAHQSEPVPPVSPPEPNVPDITNQTETDVENGSPNHQDDAKPPPRNRIVDWMLIFTAVVAVSAVIQAFITSCQWQAANDSNEIATRAAQQTERTIKLDQRPWLSAFASHNKPLKVSDSELSEWNYWSIRLKNTGKTPAKLKFAHAAIFARGFKFSIDDDIANTKTLALEKEWRATVAPESEMMFDTRTTGGAALVFGQNIEHSIKAHKMQVYLAGYFVYDDIWGDEHHTLCCFVYDPTDQKLLTLDIHNHMD